jgi:hypothetical protein
VRGGAIGSKLVDEPERPTIADAYRVKVRPEIPSSSTVWMVFQVSKSHQTGQRCLKRKQCFGALLPRERPPPSRPDLGVGGRPTLDPGKVAFGGR